MTTHPARDLLGKTAGGDCLHSANAADWSLGIWRMVHSAIRP